MAHKQYPDIAAARHMSTARMTDESTSLQASSPAPPRTSPAGSPAPSRAAVPEPAVRPAQPARSARYRRQRAAAVTVITLIALAIPTLAILLFVFG